jgi:hypothetical protein
MTVSPTECSWCVLEFVRRNSFVAVQRAIRRQFLRRSPPEMSHHFQRHYQKFKSASTRQSATSHKTCLTELAGMGVSPGHLPCHTGGGGGGGGGPTNAVKVTIKMTNFAFKIVVKTCICVLYFHNSGISPVSLGQ